jgi:hypothetical protein
MHPLIMGYSVGVAKRLREDECWRELWEKKLSWTLWKMKISMPWQRFGGSSLGLKDETRLHRERLRLWLLATGRRMNSVTQKAESSLLNCFPESWPGGLCWWFRIYEVQDHAKGETNTGEKEGLMLGKRDSVPYSLAEPLRVHDCHWFYGLRITLSLAAFLSGE